MQKHRVRGVPSALSRSIRNRMGLPAPRLHYTYLDGLRDDPLGALAQSGRRLPVIEVGFDRLRPYALSVPVSDPDRNPFTRTVRDHLDGRASRYAGSALETYYSHRQPRTLADVYGVHGELHPAMSGPPTPDCLPWAEGSWPDELSSSRRIHEARTIELFGAEGAPHGYRSFGPVSDAAGERYFRDYVDLADSIASGGYRHSLAEVPLMELLVDGQRWAGRMRGGNHRCAVMAALGHQSFLVAVSRRVVKRDRAREWPGVRSGLYTEQQAVAVFDKFLTGEVPSYCN